MVDARPPHRTLRQFTPDGPLEEHKMEKRGSLHLGSVFTDAVKEDKLEQLVTLLKRNNFREASIIVFCRRRDTVMEVYKYLKERFLGVTVCHGGMTQEARS